VTPLQQRLFDQLRATHERLGHDGPGDAPTAAELHDMELHELSPGGVLGIGQTGYLLVAFPPSERRQATRAAVKVIGEALASRGELRMSVYMLNWPSIRCVRKLGGELLGVDRDHFYHYRLTQGGYRYGQAGSAGPA
jgi:hypothetical protein